MRRWGALLLLPLLAQCGRPPAAADAGNVADQAQVPDLERAAIEAGLVADPENSDITGLYARDTDRVCVVPDPSGYRIGTFVDYGEALSCSAAGRVTRAGSALRIDFGKDCAFEARFEGDRIVFPAEVPAGCEALCSERATLGALDVTRLSDTPAEARTMRDGRGALLCGDDR